MPEVWKSGLWFNWHCVWCNSSLPPTIFCPPLNHSEMTKTRTSQASMPSSYARALGSSCCALISDSNCQGSYGCVRWKSWPIQAYTFWTQLQTWALSFLLFWHCLTGGDQNINLASTVSTLDRIDSEVRNVVASQRLPVICHSKRRERCPTSPNLPRAPAGSRARRLCGLCGPYGPRRPTIDLQSFHSFYSFHTTVWEIQHVFLLVREGYTLAYLLREGAHGHAICATQLATRGLHRRYAEWEYKTFRASFGLLPVMVTSSAFPFMVPFPFHDIFSTAHSVRAENKLHKGNRFRAS